MRQFIARYFLFLALLLVFFYLPISPISLFLNKVQTDLTLTLLDLFLKPGQLQGIDIIISPYYKVIINRACNGMIPILFLSASILAYPKTLLHKVVWIFIGYLTFTVVNVVRILIVLHSVELEGGRENFHWSHDIIGNSILLVVGLGLFLVFTKGASRNPMRS